MSTDRVAATSEAEVDLRRRLRAAVDPMAPDALDRLADAVAVIPQQRPIGARIRRAFTSRSQRRRLVLIAIAATALALVAGSLGYVGGRLERDDPINRVVTPSVAPVSTNGRIGPPPPIYATWQPVDVPPPRSNTTSSMAAITTFRDRFVAVGWESAGDQQTPASWTSSTAASWTRSDSGTSAGDGFMWGIAATSTRLVAVGSDVWTSVDASTWTRVSGAPDLRTIVAAGDRFIGVTQPNENGPIEAWQSADGTHWTRLATLDRPTPGDAPVRLRVIQQPGGSAPMLAAVGYNTAVWTASVDRPEAWTARRVGNAGDISLSDVASHGDKVLTVGTVGYCCRVRLFSSSDATVWSNETGILDDQAAQAYAIIGTARGWILAGAGPFGEASRPSPFLGWSSEDGSHWQGLGRITTDGPVDRVEVADRIALSDDRVLFVGATWDDVGNRRALAWIVTP